MKLFYHIWLFTWISVWLDKQPISSSESFICLLTKYIHKYFLKLFCAMNHARHWKDTQANGPFPQDLSYIEPVSFTWVQTWVQILSKEFFWVFLPNDNISNMSGHLTCHFAWEWALLPLWLYVFLSLLEKWKWENFFPQGIFGFGGWEGPMGNNG